MAIVEARALIRASQTAAFELSQDYSQRNKWDPFAAKHSTYTREPGSNFADIRAWHGGCMRIEYVAWFPPERAAIRMVKGPFILESFAGSWAFKTCGEFVDARFRYQLRTKSAWRWLQPLILLYFRWETQRRLAALKHYMESGSSI